MGKKMISRIENWPTALYREIDRWRNVPFTWGRMDCCVFAANCIAAMTHVDLAFDFRDKYAGALSAARILARWGTLEQMMDEYAASFGFRIARVAQRGDVVLVPIDVADADVALGIVADRVICAPGKERLQYVPVSSARRVWTF